MTDVRCKTCDQGVLTLQKVHRMSGPAVTIGYLLLIPSLLGIAFAMFFFIMSMVGAVSVAPEKLSATTIQRLHDKMCRRISSPSWKQERYSQLGPIFRQPRHAGSRSGADHLTKKRGLANNRVQDVVSYPGD
jgi:hypothetical protein